MSPPFIVGIAGGSGSGKSTVARHVAQALPSASAARSATSRFFVETDADIRLVRRIRGDTARRGRPLEEIEQYVSTVQPMHEQFVEPSKRYADIIVPQGGHNPVAVEMIVAKIQRRLRAGST